MFVFVFNEDRDTDGSNMNMVHLSCLQRAPTDIQACVPKSDQKKVWLQINVWGKKPAKVIVQIIIFEISKEERGGKEKVKDGETSFQISSVQIQKFKMCPEDGFISVTFDLSA